MLPQLCSRCRTLKDHALGRFVKTRRWSARVWVCDHCASKERDQPQRGRLTRPSPPERQAAEALAKTGYRYICEYPLKGYFFDLAVPELRLILEIDSWSYHRKRFRQQRDRDKQVCAENYGWKVCRVNAQDDVPGRVTSLVDVRAAELGVMDLV